MTINNPKIFRISSWGSESD